MPWQTTSCAPQHTGTEAAENADVVVSHSYGGQANFSCTLTLSISCCKWQELINGRRVPVCQLVDFLKSQ